MKKHIYITAILFLFSLISGFDLKAHFGSKGPFGGSVSTILVVDSTVYIGTYSGGVYISANSRLVTWTPRPVGLKSGKITALAHTGKYLFAATADSGIFFFNSVPADKYWIKKNNGLGNLKITSLVALDSISLLAGTDGGGIYKTTDKGNTWISVNNDLLHHLEISAIVKSGNRIIHAALDGGLYASDNVGASWFDFNDPNTDDVSGTKLISLNEATNEIMVLNDNGLFIAMLPSTPTAPAFVFADAGLPKGIKISSISNDGENWWLSSDYGVYISSAKSISWSRINDSYSIPNVNAIVPYKDRLVAGTSGLGIYTAPKIFTKWTPTNSGFNNLKTYSMTSNDLVVIAATELGVFVSRDLAANYFSANNGLSDSLHVNDILFAGSWLVAATTNEGVFYSADTGKTWQKINGGLPVSNIKKVFYGIGKKYVITADGQVYSSLLAGTEWTAEQFDLPPGTIATTLCFAGESLFLGTNGQGVFMKSAGGKNWISANSGLLNLTITSLTLQGSKVFAGTTGSGIFVSDILSTSWLPLTGSPVSTHTTLVENEFASNAIEALNYNDGYLFASYMGGVFASADYGTTWIAAGNQFNLPTYTAVNKISFAKGRIFVTTENNGLYSNALSELPTIAGVSDISNNSALICLSPNPNSGKFTLSGEIKITDLAIYDYTGKLLESFASAPYLFDLNYSKGIYFVKANTDRGYVTKKFILE